MHLPEPRAAAYQSNKDLILRMGGLKRYSPARNGAVRR